jgi:hypothetical protein
MSHDQENVRRLRQIANEELPPGCAVTLPDGLARSDDVYWVRFQGRSRRVGAEAFSVDLAEDPRREKELRDRFRAIGRRVLK